MGDTVSDFGVRPNDSEIIISREVATRVLDDASWLKDLSSGVESDQVIDAKLGVVFMSNPQLTGNYDTLPSDETELRYGIAVEIARDYVDKSPSKPSSKTLGSYLFELYKMDPDFPVESIEEVGIVCDRVDGALHG
jgi:hypothetical protein